jgi:L-seryl-tRNA(Ser) seleniumtransferase
MRRNPLYRALRVDKMTIAALDATLVEHAAGHADERVPVLRMIREPLAEVEARASAFAAALRQRAPDLRPILLPSESAVGGGAAPVAGIPTVVVALEPGPKGPDAFAAALRAGSPPAVVRVEENRVLVDLRTVFPEDEEALLEALVAAGS